MGDRLGCVGRRENAAIAMPTVNSIKLRYFSDDMTASWRLGICKGRGRGCQKYDGAVQKGVQPKIFEGKGGTRKVSKERIGQPRKQ